MRARILPKRGSHELSSSTRCTGCTSESKRVIIVCGVNLISLHRDFEYCYLRAGGHRKKCCRIWNRLQIETSKLSAVAILWHDNRRAWLHRISIGAINIRDTKTNERIHKSHQQLYWLITNLSAISTFDWHSRWMAWGERSRWNVSVSIYLTPN